MVKKLLQFFSLAALTQCVLLLNQIVLLPMQIRVWGHELTTYWYSTIAAAGIITVADLGLRYAGHGEITRHAREPNDTAAKLKFRHVWAWTRILLFSAALVLIAIDFACNRLSGGTPYLLWRPALMVGMVLETILVIRITYLDSLGFYREAEAGYLLLAGMRLALAIIGLLLLRLPPSGLAWIWLFTSVLAVALQGRLCGRLGLMRVFEAIPKDLSVKTLAVSRYTMAEPCSTWVRFYLPILVLAAIASPATVTIYLALRAVFGAARATIQQLGRYASVEYLRLKTTVLPESAESFLSAFMIFTAFCGTAFAGVVIADNLRLLGIWLIASDTVMYQQMAVLFGLSCAFYSYQIIAFIMIRTGGVAQFARRVYFYVAFSGLFAAIALVSKSLLLCLLLMVLVADVGVSMSFLSGGLTKSILPPTRAGLRGLSTAILGAAFILALWFIVRHGDLSIFQTRSLLSGVGTALVLLFWIGTLALATISINVDVAKGLWTLSRYSRQAT
jgi:hypothetical protein